MGVVSAALDQNPSALKSLVTDFNTTAAAFARQSNALGQAVNELPRTLAAAGPAFNSLNAAFPPLRQFARAFDPGVRSSGPAIDASLPFITQLRLLVRPQELRGLTDDLSVAVPALAQLSQRTIPLMRDGVRPLASCVANNIIPWSHSTVPDQNFTPANGFPLRPAYVEGVDFLPGLAGESRDFDANGPYIRILAGGGTLTYSFSPGLFGTALQPVAGVQPQLPPGGRRPPLHPRVACETQAPTTDLSAPVGSVSGPVQNGAGPQNAGAAAFRRASDEQAIATARQLIKQEKLPLRVADLGTTK